MPHVRANGVELFYDIAGPDGAPVLALSNSIGATLEMWDEVAAALADHWRVLRYDARGHGRSEVVDSPARVEDLADDLAGLLDALGIDKAHIAGLSLGGMTGQSFALRHSRRATSLTLMATAAYLPPAEAWERRAQAVLRDGMGAVVDAVLTRWFTPAFQATDVAKDWGRRLRAIDPRGYAACCAAIRDMDLRPAISAIRVPTLVVVGADDPATPPAMAEEIRSLIPDAELVVLPRAAHLLSVERADAVSAHLAAFLQRVEGRRAPQVGGASFASGLANRKAALGAEHVERSLAAAGDFAMPWQDFVTRYAWGEIWGDPALPRKTRSMLTLAMMVALHREEEFKLHVRPALRNGVTLDELRALLLQSAIYAGVPAANAGFRWTRDVLGAELDVSE